MPERKRNPRGRPASLSKERILEAALAMPFSQLSMLKLAGILRVSDAALYYYFPTSDDLRRAVVNAMTESFKLPRKSSDWRSWMRRFSLAIYAFLEDRPGIAQFMMSSGPSGYLHYQVMEKALGILKDAGFSSQQAWMIYCSSINLTIEYAQKRDEYRRLADRKGLDTRHRFEAETDALPVESFPHIREAVAYQAQLPDSALFTFNLEVLLSLTPETTPAPK